VGRRKKAYLGEDKNQDEGNGLTDRRMSFSSLSFQSLLPLSLVFFFPLYTFSFLFSVLSSLSFFFVFWILFVFGFLAFFAFSPPSFPLESSVFIGNIPGSPSARGSFLDKHDWEGGVGFLLGLGYLRFDPYIHGVVIFMKIRFAICVLVGLGCRHSIIFFPSFQADLQR